MKREIMEYLIIIALAIVGLGCGKAAGKTSATSAASPTVTAASATFPSDLQFQQPQGVK